MQYAINEVKLGKLSNDISFNFLLPTFSSIFYNPICQYMGRQFYQNTCMGHYHISVDNKKMILGGSCGDHVRRNRFSATMKACVFFVSRL